MPRSYFFATCGLLATVTFVPANLFAARGVKTPLPAIIHLDGAPVGSGIRATVATIGVGPTKGIAPAPANVWEAAALAAGAQHAQAELPPGADTVVGGELLADMPRHRAVIADFPLGPQEQPDESSTPRSAWDQLQTRSPFGVTTSLAVPVDIGDIVRINREFSPVRWRGFAKLQKNEGSGYLVPAAALLAAGVAGHIGLFHMFSDLFTQVSQVLQPHLPILGASIGAVVSGATMDTTAQANAHGGDLYTQAFSAVRRRAVESRLPSENFDFTHAEAIPDASGEVWKIYFMTPRLESGQVGNEYVATVLHRLAPDQSIIVESVEVSSLEGKYRLGVPADSIVGMMEHLPVDRLERCRNTGSKLTLGVKPDEVSTALQLHWQEIRQKGSRIAAANAVVEADSASGGSRDWRTTALVLMTLLVIVLAISGQGMNPARMMGVHGSDGGQGAVPIEMLLKWLRDRTP